MNLRGAHLSALAPALVAMLTSHGAHAEWEARPGVDGIVVVDEGEVAGGAFGSAVFGYNPELEPVLVIPEIAGGFGYFGGEVRGALGRALAGARVGLSLSVEPSLFVHLGYGYGEVTRAGVRDGEHGFALRTGVALDYRVARWITVGGQLVYDVLLFGDAGEVGALHSPGAGFTAAFWF